MGKEGQWVAMQLAFGTAQFGRMTERSQTSQGLVTPTPVTVTAYILVKEEIISIVSFVLLGISMLNDLM